MKYLIEIHHGIGDIVQITGLLDSIKMHDKEAYIALILNNEAYKTLFDFDDRVDAFYRIDLKEMSKLQLMQEAFKIRKKKFDYFMLSPISNPKASVLLTLLLGAKVSAGEQLAGMAKVSKRFRYIEPEDTHIVVRNENVMLGLIGDAKRCQPRLVVAPTNKCEISHEAVALCVGTSIPQKTWPAERYFQVADHFAAQGYQIVLLGGQKEKKLFEEYLVDRKGYTNCLGKLTLAESASVASQCALVIGGDTGVMHMAAAVGAKTLTLFSCTDPRLHCPYSVSGYYYRVPMPCQYCYEHGKVDQCTDYKCIKAIDAENIIQVAEKILAGDTESLDRAIT